MAYTPPTTFVDGTTLQASGLLANDDALRDYLHEGVANADLRTSARWVETRHIQQPSFEPFSGLQHGVSGWQGGHNSGGPRVKYTFTTSFLAGTSRSTLAQWVPVPETYLELDTRRSGKVLFHWHLEQWVGPDEVTSIVNPTAQDDRRVYLAPCVSRGGIITPSTDRAQEKRQNVDGFVSPTGAGAEFPYNLTGYGLHSGTHLVTFGTGERVAVGLAFWSSVSQSLIFNWSIAVEAWY